MAEQAGSAMLITADRVWTGVGRDVIDRGFVLTEGPLITAAGRQADLGSVGDAVTRVDLGDCTLLPGLVNGHVHLIFSASPTPVEDYLAEAARGVSDVTIRVQQNAQAGLRVGVTTVRDLGGPNEPVFAVRDAINDGRVLGSRIVASGAPITITGGHCHWFSHECDTEDEIRRAVRRQVNQGADLIKIFATGGNLTPRTNPFAPQYNAGQIEACVEEARRLGVPIAAHAHAPEGIKRAADAGVDTIEHCFFETADGVEFDPTTADTMAASGIAFVPTGGHSLMRFLADPSLIQRPTLRRLIARYPQISDALRRLHASGAPLLMGSDAGIPNRHHTDFPADVVAMASEQLLGLAPHVALEAATSAAAARLGLDDCGVLEPRRRADLLAVDGNPLVDLNDLTRARFVSARGVPVLGVGPAN